MKRNKIIFLTLTISIFSIRAQSLYLDLMKRCLLNFIYQDPGYPNTPFNQLTREEGRDWPTQAHSMIGMVGLNNIQNCLEEILQNNIPGDCVETGVWRGGAVIFMRAILKEYNITDRNVWVADSFEGMPTANVQKYPADYYSGGPNGFKTPFLAVSLETVQGNFAKYNLLDDQVKFLKGWFKNTLPTAPITKIALLRLDGDLYESTIDALNSLYPKLSVGGYLLIDDYAAWKGCAKAVEDYRVAHHITEPIQHAGWSIVYWKKTHEI